MMNAQVNNGIVLAQMQKVALAFDMAEVDPDQLKQTLIDTVFKGADDVQLVSLLIVANQYKLNPFTKEIYAFPAKGGGITPVVGIDGWSRIINDNPKCDGIQFEEDDKSCTCKIHRKDRTHPTVVTEYLDECKGTSEPWKKYPKRMLRHKALIQCARVAFGFSGIYDEDEARRIDDCYVGNPKTVTPETIEGYEEFEAENLQAFKKASEYGTEKLKEKQSSLNGKNPIHKEFWMKHSPDFKEIAQLADQALAKQGETYEHTPA